MLSSLVFGFFFLTFRVGCFLWYQRSTSRVVLVSSIKSICNHRHHVQSQLLRGFASFLVLCSFFFSRDFELVVSFGAKGLADLLVQSRLSRVFETLDCMCKANI